MNTAEVGSLRGTWYDGRSSRGQSVLISLRRHPDGPMLHWETTDPPSQVHHALDARRVVWPEQFSETRGPVTIDLAESGSLQIDDGAAWFDAFKVAGGRQKVSERMQQRWGWLFGVLAVAVAVLLAFYKWGTPWAATVIASHVPASWESDLSTRALGDLDRQLLKPSKLAGPRQAALRERFDALVKASGNLPQPYPGYRPVWQLHFRSGFGPNALALPGGTVIVTDDLVEEADRLGHPDDAIAGVLAHEIGHVLHRHTTRMVIQNAVVGVAFGLVVGDITSFLSLTGTALTGLAYQRAHETQADCFAAVLMQATGTSPAPMADLLLDMEQKIQGDSNSVIYTLLSTHPGSAERALQLKQGHPQGCS